MTTFDQREAAFENRYAHDEEMSFRAHARCNVKLGLWAAELLGKTGNDAAEYAQALVAAEIEGVGSEAVVKKLLHDLHRAGIAQSEHQIRRHMEQFLAEAEQEVRTV